MFSNEKDRKYDRRHSSWPSQTTPETSRASNMDDRVRLFLVGWIAFVIILILLVFVVTRDGSILAANTVFAAAITLVFTYYFRKKS